MLDSIYHMTLKLRKEHIFGFLPSSFMQRYKGRHLGDNCIQNFHFRIYGRKLSFTAARKRNCKT